MTNPHRIDLLKNHAAGDIVTEPVKVRAGSVAIFLKAVMEPSAVIKLQQRPADGVGWYEKPAGVFIDTDLDSEGQVWINANLAEGEVRAVLEGTSGGTEIIEFLLRPVFEYEYEV